MRIFAYPYCVRIKKNSLYKNNIIMIKSINYMCIYIYICVTLYVYKHVVVVKQA